MGKTFYPRKRFGQHFLADIDVVWRMVDAIHPCPGDFVVEIGSGFGALTKVILPRAGEMSVIEIDRDVIPFLKAACEPLGSLKIYNEDALQFDFSSLISEGRPLRIVGNLPYNISSPLIFHLLSFCRQGSIRDMHFMVQNEVADRLAASPSSKDYGRLTVMVQYVCKVEKLFTVPKEAFNPAPQVTSAVIRLLPYREPPFPANDFKILENVVRQAFSQRRKTLRNALRSMVPLEVFQRLNIDTGQRPENLSVENFVLLANEI